MIRFLGLITAICLMAGIMLSGCATHPKKIAAQYVSPLKYKDYSEDQIVMEMDRIGQRTNELYHSLRKEANADAWQTGVGFVFFWPVLFALEGGDGPEATEYARLKGEYEALRQVSFQKNMNLTKIPPSPDEIVKQEEEKLKNESKK